MIFSSPQMGSGVINEQPPSQVPSRIAHLCYLPEEAKNDASCCKGSQRDAVAQGVSGLHQNIERDLQRQTSICEQWPARGRGQFPGQRCCLLRNCSRLPMAWNLSQALYRSISIPTSRLHFLFKHHLSLKFTVSEFEWFCKAGLSEGTVGVCRAPRRPQAGPSG